MKFLKDFCAGSSCTTVIFTLFIGLISFESIVEGLYLNNESSNSTSKAPVKRSASQTSNQKLLLEICELLKSQENNQNRKLGDICNASQSELASLSPERACISKPKRRGSGNQTAHLTLLERLSHGVSQMKEKGAKFDRKDAQAVFIFGNPGSGKSTLTQLLNGNLSQLYATKETDEGPMIILDYEGLITPPEVDEDVIPNFKINPTSGHAFWDFPSFHENRSVETDILANYLVKRALGQVSQAKFLFTIDHQSVLGNDTADFYLLVRHATKLLRNPVAHAESIGLIVTKVATTNSTEDGSQVLQQVEKFMENYVQELTDKMKTSNDKSEKLSLGKSIQFVQIFLNATGDDDTASKKISFVRTPPHCGALVDMPSFLKARGMITDLYFKHLKYSAVNSQDFEVAVTNNQTIERVSEKHIPEVIEAIGQTLEKGVNASLKQFLEHFYDQVKNGHVNTPALLLGSKLTRAKCTPSSVNESYYQLVITGGHVKFSEFLNLTQDPLISTSLSEWPYPCSGENVNQLIIMARDQVTIDYDLNADCKQLQVSIIAPKWEIIGDQRTIQLGCSETPNAFAESAPSGSGYGDGGKNGAPGRKGMNAGSLFGIFSQVVNGKALYINADGGRGGAGQDGGQGYEGGAGKNANFDKFESSNSTHVTGDFYRGNATESENSTLSIKATTNPSSGFVNGEWYTLSGEKGKQGGSGGKGGDGGEPGHSGIILLASTSTKGQHSFNVSMKRGESGEPGKGGAGGLGGFRGSHVSCQSNTSLVPPWLKHSCFYDTFNMSRRAEPGKNGSDGESPSYATQVPVGLFNNKSENWRIINEYKQAFSESIPKPKFIYELNRNPKIKDLTTPPTFEDDIKYMEKNGEWRNAAGVSSSNRASEKLIFLEDFQQKSDKQLERFLAKNVSLSTLLEELTNDIGLSVNRENCIIESLTELEMQLNFFKSQTTGKQLAERGPSLCLPSLKKLSMEIKSIKEFYELCENLNVELSSYSKQVILSELKRNGTLNLDKNSNEVLQFLNTHRLLPVSYENVTLREDKEADKYLTNLVQSQTLNVNLKCEKSSLDKEMHQLVVSGKHVKFSDFLNASLSPPWPHPCTSKEALKEISIMAQDKLFIDYDLDGDCYELQVSIIAPHWEVIGDKRMIQLGCSQVGGYTESAPAGSEYGDRGKNGAVGNNGTNAGSFFGIFSHIKNDQALYINADGGKGGQGQNGGRGHDGKPGDSATEETFPSATGASKNSDLTLGYLDESGNLIEKAVVTLVYNEEWYTYYGQHGKQGAQGGNGGDGGLPGHPGSIVLISSSEQSSNNIQTSVKDGLGGDPGVGGVGGGGGKRGDHMSCKQSYSFFAFWWQGCYTKSSSSTASSGETGKDGTTPAYDESSRPPNNFESWRFINKFKQTYFETSTKKTKFMNELDYNREIVSLVTPLSFAEELDSVEQIYWRAGASAQKRAEETFFAFYEDFLARLKNYATQKRGTKMDMPAPRSNATLSSVSNDTSITETTGLLASEPILLKKGEKIALNYIYAATLGKMIGMRQNMNTLNVINTKEYFDAISKQLDLLRQSQKENAIADESLKYKEKLNDKANEAMNFITGTVKPALKKAEDYMEEQNEKLFKEMNEHIRSSEENVKKQRKIKKDFQNSLVLRNLMGGLKVVGAVAQFCGPWGKVAGTVISGATSIAEPLLLDEFPSQKASNVPYDQVSAEFTSMIKDRNDKYHDRKIENIQAQIKEAEEAVKKDGIEPESLGEVKKKMENVKEAADEYKQAKASKGSPDPVQIIEKEMKLDTATRELEQSVVSSNEVEKTHATESNNENSGPTANSDSKGGETSTAVPPSKEDELKSKLERRKASKEKASKIISGLEKGLKVAGAGIDFAQGISQQNAEVDRLNKLIEEAEENVKAKESYKELLYKEFLPKLATATSDIKGQGNDLPGQSAAGLTVKKWKLKGMMKEMKKTMVEFTKGMEVAEEFQLCVDRLDEAMTLLIDLYDQIERYEEKKQLADYIANINSASDAKSKIEDGELKKAIARMEFSLHANLFVEDYHRAMGAFKQWVFPFAAHYLIQEERIDLISLMNMTTSEENVNSTSVKSAENRALDEVVVFYKKKVEQISNQIAEYHATTVTTDENLLVSPFSGDTVSSHPFYVWTNDKWQGSIKRLLSGKDVLLKADMDKDPMTAQMLNGKSAIKFKWVEAHFRANNQSLQNDLNEKLKHFQMKMTHCGISTYRMMGQKYVMFDRNQTYRFSFERKEGEKRGALIENVVSKKAQGKADFLMSPYTWWTFQLIDATPGKGESFETLTEDFEGKVNLELIGEGIFLDEVHGLDVNKLKNLNMEHFYEAYDKNHDEHFERKSTKVSRGSFCEDNIK